MITPFNIATVPALHFGAGKIESLPNLAKNFGSKILLVTGAKSFISSPCFDTTINKINEYASLVAHYIIGQEPTPSMIDQAVEKYSSSEIQVVIAIGGGSVLDAGKAIAAMLPLKEPVKNYLEGVGTKSHPGKKVPFIAVPTTAGTGSEATKNAVLSETGVNGYKKSLRHNNFVPDFAIIDPELMISCSKATTAASGMDAFTQLLESYLSTAANPFTDALALEGLKRVAKSLLKAYEDGSNLEARTDMALAAYFSGITLANAGLGLVHGFASSVGGFFDIPHGVICSSLMPEANKVTVRELRNGEGSGVALAKYAAIGKIFSGLENKTGEYYTDFLLSQMTNWCELMAIPKLKSGGITTVDFERIVKETDNKNNPARIDKEGMIEVLAGSL